VQSDRIYVSVGIVEILHVRARQCTSTPSLQTKLTKTSIIHAGISFYIFFLLQTLVLLIGFLHERANIEQTSSWLKLAYWNPSPGSNVGLGLGS